MLNVLHTALGKMGNPIVRHVMNPKALERSKLLGRMDNDTREWTDGVLTAAARQVQREPTTTHTWIVSDGDGQPSASALESFGCACSARRFCCSCARS